MGCLDDDFRVVFEKPVSSGFLTIDFESEPETIAIQDAVKILLQGLGEDVNREGLKKTPLRVAKALREGTRGYKQNVDDIVGGALFPEAGLDNGFGHGGGAGGLVNVQDLDLFSYCEACVLPFHVKCHIGYVPHGQRVVGLSKLSRVADVFSKRLQDPQRLADEICSALHQSIKPAGVAVVLQCSHLKFPNLESAFLETTHQGWVKLLVSSGSGVFENEKTDIWSDFLSLVDHEGLDKTYDATNSTTQSWCPCLSTAKMSAKLGPAEQTMVAAVSSILKTLGEDPSREELVGTPSCFVKWFMKFQKANLEMKLNGFATSKTNLHRPNTEVYRNKDHHMHCELNLSVWSQCEHHLLPFYGVVHVGYFCGEGSSLVNRSLLQSIVHFYGLKLQVQERLSRQILETVSSLVGGNGGVMVHVWAKHTCMICRGIEKVGSSTKTQQWQGRFSTDHKARIQFNSSIPKTFIPGGW